MREPLRFQAIYQERVWGGRALETVLGRTLPAGRPIGESWEIVDRPEAQSVLRGGPLSGKTLHEALQIEGSAIMGPKWRKDKPFPILVKWLDCRERLSLQVHPPAEVAEELHGEPKTENWYIAGTAPGSQLIVGLTRGVTRAQFEAALAANALEACVHHIDVAVGDSILVHSGEVHAIGAGNLILEIQQNSDTTYRVFDWGRMGLDGKPRTIHLAESLKSIHWDDFEPEVVRGAPTSGTIADCAQFRIRRLVLSAGETHALPANDQPRIVSAVSGEVECSGVTLGRGENALIPYEGAFRLTALAPAILLVTENFA